MLLAAVSRRWDQTRGQIVSKCAIIAMRRLPFVLFYIQA